jgi:hypothetical protein
MKLDLFGRRKTDLDQALSYLLIKATLTKQEVLIGDNASMDSGAGYPTMTNPKWITESHLEIATNSISGQYTQTSELH